MGGVTGNTAVSTLGYGLDTQVVHYWDRLTYHYSVRRHLFLLLLTARFRVALLAVGPVLPHRGQLPRLSVHQAGSGPGLLPAEKDRIVMI